MSERHLELMVLSHRSDERLRVAFAELDALASARGNAVSHEVANVCSAVIEEACWLVTLVPCAGGA